MLAPSLWHPSTALRFLAAPHGFCSCKGLWLRPRLGNSHGWGRWVLGAAPRWGLCPGQGLCSAGPGCRQGCRAWAWQGEEGTVRGQACFLSWDAPGRAGGSLTLCPRGAGPPRSRLEPMDTIFVKNVREDGPAHQAGLRTGEWGRAGWPRWQGLGARDGSSLLEGCVRCSPSSAGDFLASFALLHSFFFLPRASLCSLALRGLCSHSWAGMPRAALGSLCVRLVVGSPQVPTAPLATRDLALPLAKALAVFKPYCERPRGQPSATTSPLTCSDTVFSTLLCRGPAGQGERGEHHREDLLAGHRTDPEQVSPLPGAGRSAGTGRAGEVT